MRITALLLSLLVFTSSFPIKPYALGATMSLSREQETKPIETALLEAVEFGHPDVIKKLLASGADPNARSFQGNSPLMYAARNGSVEVVRDLLAAGADPNLANKDGMDALMAATSRGHREIAAILKKAGANPASEQFIVDIQAVARRFAERLQQTRDFAPLINEFFDKRFLDCHVQGLLERQENGIFSQIGSVTLTPEVVTQLSHQELKEHLITSLNFFHLRTLYRLSSFEWGADQRAAADVEEREYPRAVYEWLKNNPAAIQTIQTVDQARARAATLEQASAMMREYLLAHTPEEREALGKNLQRIGNKEHDSKFWEIGLWKLKDKEAEEVGKCFGERISRLAVVKVPPFYNLFFIEAGKSFRIATMLCSEPPCAD